MLPLLLYRLNRIQTPVSVSRSPLNTCFSDFTSDVTPPHRTLRVCVYASRKQIGCISRLQCARLYRAQPGCAVLERRERDGKIPVLDRWISTCLLTKKYPIVGNRPPRSRSRYPHIPNTLALRFSPPSFFSLSFPRTFSFTANAARGKIKIATNSPISRLLRYPRRVYLLLLLHSPSGRC